MNIDFLCSDTRHPVNSVLTDWLDRNTGEHRLKLVHQKCNLLGGDLLFLISCHELIDAKTRHLYSTTFVLHASDLPAGRGWSPHVWTILSGSNEIVVTLLEADDKPDHGDIWAQRRIQLEGHELCTEINDALFRAEIELIEYSIKHYSQLKGRPQVNSQSYYYPRRYPDDSRLDPYKSIADQFDLLRVADSDRYPAFFDYRGHRFYLKISKEA